MSQRPVYGNITTPRSAGFLGLSMAAAAVALAVVVVAAIMLMLSWLWLALAVLVVGMVFTVWIATGKKQGRSRFEQYRNKAAFKKAKRKGTTRYVSGPTSKIPDGTSRAPGLLAPTEPYEGIDAFGHRFGMLWNGREKTGTIFFACAGEGRGLNDQSSIDMLVDGWAGFQAQAGLMVDLLQIAVVTQATRDPGERLPAAIREARERHGTGDPESVDPFVREVTDEIVDSVNADMPRITQHVAMTFSAAEMPAQGTVTRTAEDMLEDLAIQVPALKEQIAAAGSHNVSVMKMIDIVDYAYVAYNPDRALSVERARERARVNKGNGTGLSWFEVGPVSARSTEKYWEHSGYVSQSHSVWKPHSGFFADDSLDALLLEDGVSEQKRIVMIFCVLSPEKSVAVLSADAKDRSFELNQGGKAATAAGVRELSSAQESSSEQAHGAAVVRHSFVMTTTVLAGPDQETRLLKAEAALRRACSIGVQMSIRPSDGSHDAGHAISLGLGIVPGKYATVSSALRRSL